MSFRSRRALLHSASSSRCCSADSAGRVAGRTAAVAALAAGGTGAAGALAAVAVSAAAEVSAAAVADLVAAAPREAGDEHRAPVPPPLHDRPQAPALLSGSRAECDREGGPRE